MNLKRISTTLASLVTAAGLTIGAVGVASTPAGAAVTGPGEGQASTQVIFDASTNRITYNVDINSSESIYGGLSGLQTVGARAETRKWVGKDRYGRNVWGPWRYMNTTAGNPYGWQLVNIPKASSSYFTFTTKGLTDGYYEVRMVYTWHIAGYWYGATGTYDYIQEIEPTYQSWAQL
jgi:hypothetical protein